MCPYAARTTYGRMSNFKFAFSFWNLTSYEFGRWKKSKISFLNFLTGQIFDIYPNFPYFLHFFEKLRFWEKSCPKEASGRRPDTWFRNLYMRRPDVIKNHFRKFLRKIFQLHKKFAPYYILGAPKLFFNHLKHVSEPWRSKSHRKGIISATCELLFLVVPLFKKRL